jgi:mono/diheme cytochrome c family protein
VTRRTVLMTIFLAGATALTFVARAQEHSLGTNVNSSARSSASKKKNAPTQSEFSARIEGEKRYRQNCGRCHLAPQKFPPRMMATIIRHMRVRATITDEDARLILQYMTQ